MKTIGYTVVLLGLAAVTALAQDRTEIRRQLEAGQYDNVVRAVEQAGDVAADRGPILYTAAEAYQRMNQPERALDLYNRLAESPEGDPWRLIGQSGRDLAQGNVDQAADEAKEAITISDGVPEAHYQLGLVLAKKEDWPGAAAEFTRASQLDPNYAYAYYRAGMMHYRAKRVDQMANAFEAFLKLAPEAPERPEVQQIMRTVRGR